MSSESREQFRERIGRLTHDAMVQRIERHIGEPAPSYDVENAEFHEWLAEIGMAGYTAALRDVRDLFRHLGDEDAQIFAADMEVESYATRLGIDLEDDTVRDMSGYTAADYAAGRDDQP